MKNGTLGLIAIVAYFAFRLIFDYLADKLQMDVLNLGGMIAGCLTLAVVAVILIVRSGKNK